MKDSTVSIPCSYASGIFRQLWSMIALINKYSRATAFVYSNRWCNSVFMIDISTLTVTTRIQITHKIQACLGAHTSNISNEGS